MVPTLALQQAPPWLSLKVSIVLALFLLGEGDTSRLRHMDGVTVPLVHKFILPKPENLKAKVLASFQLDFEAAA